MAKISFSLFWRLWERKFLQTRCLDQIRREEDLSPEKLTELQNRKLGEIFKHAAAYVSHYRSEFERLGIATGGARPLDLLKSLPMLDKKMIQQSPGRLLSKNAARHGLSYWNTSGSSGMPLRVVTNPWESAMSQALVRYGFLRSGAKPGQKIVMILNITAPSTPLKKDITDIFQWHRLDLKNDLSYNLNALERLKPEIIYSYPSYLALLCQYAQERNLKVFSPGLIFTHGEMLTATVKNLAQKTFQCRVRNTYGSTEFQRIAYECKEEKLHVLESSLLVETFPPQDSGVTEDEGEEIVITSLYHKTMPFIRYRLGDRVHLLKNTCRCGARGKIIQEVTGRQEDMLTLPSGRRISARWINMLDDIPHILEYQIVQKSPEFFEVLIRPTPHFNNFQEEQIRRMIQAGCCGETVRVEIRKTTQLRRSANGKLKTILSEVKPSDTNP